MKKSLETMENICHVLDYVQEQTRSMARWLGFGGPERGHSSAAGI